MNSLPQILKPAADRIAVGHLRAQQTQHEADTQDILGTTERARYKIEIHFGKDRTTSGLCSGCITIWESGLRMHGGGDEKMYWCGYSDCGKPIASSNFGYAHAVCPVCSREQFLDDKTKGEHVKYLIRENQRVGDLDKLPIVVGEKFFKLYPPSIADLLTTTFNDLNRDTDIYLKYHPLDMRYEGKNETVADLKRLELARIKREPVIYPLSRIIKDLNAGADLKARFLAMITA
jgi:hypothetical protein